jgi:ABC-type microcin C transport system permease subunit YejE
MIITADHITYNEEPLVCEYNHARLWYIIKNYPQNEGEFELIRRNSYYWYNITQLECEYNATIHKRINCDKVGI